MWNGSNSQDIRFEPSNALELRSLKLNSGLVWLTLGLELELKATGNHGTFSARKKVER